MRTNLRPSRIGSVACVVALLTLTGVTLAKKDDAGNKVKPAKVKGPSDPGTDPAAPQDGAPGKPEPKPKLTGEQRWMLNLKEQLKATDEEWAVLSPRLEQVMRLQREVAAGRDPKGPREPRPLKDPKPGESPQPVPEVLAKARALNATLFDQSAASADVRAKVTAIREARAKARRELAQRQEDLRQLLTYRQEAVLIIMGVLE
jgi:hypothetical protein